MPFQPGNTEGRKSQKHKPYRDALLMEVALAEKGEESPAPIGSLRWIARQQLIRAGEDTSAVKEIADRLDGKVPQAVGGVDEDGDLAPLVPIINLSGRPGSSSTS
jgi:hypothetical protein